MLKTENSYTIIETQCFTSSIHTHCKKKKKRKKRWNNMTQATWSSDQNEMIESLNKTITKRDTLKITKLNII